MNDLIHVIHEAYYKLSRIDLNSKPEMKLGINQTMTILAETIDYWKEQQPLRVVHEEKIYDDESPTYITGTEDGI